MALLELQEKGKKEFPFHFVSQTVAASNRKRVKLHIAMNIRQWTERKQTSGKLKLHLYCIVSMKHCYFSAISNTSPYTVLNGQNVFGALS